MSLISADNIYLDTNYKTQDEVFSKIAELSIEKNISSNGKEVYKDLKKRENEGTTGMMDGFAIPHASSKSINIPGVLIIKNNIPLEWNSMDEKPITFIIALLIPSDEKSTTHLEILKDISIKLMKPEIRANLLNAQNKNEILEILNKPV